MAELFTTRQACPTCGKTDPNVLVDRPLNDDQFKTYLSSYYHAIIPEESLNGQRFRVALCHCGFVWQMDTLNNQGMELLYNTWIDAGASRQKRQAAKLPYYLGLARNLARCKLALDETEGMKSLDYGMGWGHWAAMALAFGFDSYGYELSPARIAFANQNGIKCARDLDALDPGTFHLINAEQVLEHVPDPKETFSTFSRLLVKGGLVQVAVPDGTKDITALRQAMWRPKKGPTQPLEHINTFTPKTLAAMGERAGLKVDKVPFLTSGLIKLPTSYLPKSLYLKLTKTRLFFRKTI